MFGVIRCPVCGEIQGIETRHRTTSCRKCGKRMEVNRVGLLGTFDDQETMRSVMWDLKSGKMDASEEGLKDEMISGRKSPGKRSLNKQGKEDLLIEILEDGMDEMDDIIERMAVHDIGSEEVASIIKSLQKKNLIYSPRYNVYRKV